jgi:hypothetical protein
VFRGATAGEYLNSEEKRREFSQRYGGGSKRLDDTNREWKLTPRLFHGTEKLHISGYRLRGGFHWDVSPTSSSGPAKIVTTTAVWKVERYANVAPDAHVRGNPPNAEKIFSQK